MSNSREVVDDIASALARKVLYLSTAESCTGGLMGHILTNREGSSRWYNGGVVAYSNQLKMSFLGVREETLRDKGAVSQDCVREMARGITFACRTGAGIAVSGVAGPGGGTEEKPVGTVWMAWKIRNQEWTKEFSFSGDRLQVKEKSALYALAELRDWLRG